MVHVAILAGGSRKSNIRKQPKCFLDMPTGECVVEEILHAIDPIKKIESIVIIGPEAGLQKLEARNVKRRFKHRIALVPQGRNLQDNLILAKQSCLKMNKMKVSQAEALGLLYLFGDTPFRKQCAVEEFISQIDTNKDLIISWVDETLVMKYYRMFKKPMIPVWLDGKPGNFKETNMIYLNPDKIVGNVTKRLYSLRHTSRLSTMIQLRKVIYQLGGKRFLSILQWGFFVRQWHKTFRKVAPRAVHTPSFLYKKLDKDYLVKVLEESFGIKADVALSSYPDGFIDLDSRADFKKIYGHYFSLDRMISRDCRTGKKNGKRNIYI
jgi:hypothetical protein